MFQPALNSAEDSLVAKAMKALFFEAVLNSERRREADHGMPLVAYVADEFHRFVTSDLVHGEQSFLDTCRSFGAFCVLACQSVASLRHALGRGERILALDRTGHRHHAGQQWQQAVFPLDRP